jgi:hypothetical protein
LGKLPVFTVHDYRSYQLICFVQAKLNFADLAGQRVELVRVILVGGEGWAVHAVAYLEGEGENE